MEAARVEAARVEAAAVKRDLRDVDATRLTWVEQERRRELAQLAVRSWQCNLSQPVAAVAAGLQ